MKNQHAPVLLSEVLAYLKPQPNESYLDLTAGYGGHAKAILDVTLNYKDSVLVDRDEFAVENLTDKFGGNITIMNTDFYSAVSQLIECGKTFDLILADFGVSSPQLDNDDRGFSYKNDGPLDMRMDRRQSLTAEKIVNSWSERDLLAREIVTHRPLTTTKQLVDLILSKSRFSRTHPAAPIFQAIRIAVNDELKEIEKTLPLLPKLLNQNGRVGIISFHSLEDRLAKEFFKEASSYGEESELTLVTKKPIVAGPNELVINPRARSAKLRVATRH